MPPSRRFSSLLAPRTAVGKHAQVTPPSGHVSASTCGNKPGLLDPCDALTQLWKQTALRQRRARLLGRAMPRRTFREQLEAALGITSTRQQLLPTTNTSPHTPVNAFLVRHAYNMAPVTSSRHYHTRGQLPGRGNDTRPVLATCTRSRTTGARRCHAPATGTPTHITAHPFLSLTSPYEPL